ncbi:hypothetical protein FQA39_LY12316 [Lamprigera yunnana]|nr:hypothetical protein FQA39_LY12316 [Lamprigera yunnana]
MKLLVIFFAIIQQLVAKSLPSFLHVCNKSDPNLAECVTTAIEELRPYLVKGVPEFNIPSIEPLFMNELISEESGDLRIIANNVKTYGCSDFFVRGMKMNLDDQYYEIDIELPLLRIEAYYNVSGKVLMMPIRGEGPLQANVTNCRSRTVLKGELYDKNGETYIRYKEMTMHVIVGGGIAKVENLFNGDKFLNDMINDVINKNFDAFLLELMPVIERSLTAAFLEIANAIVAPYTFKQLYPH